MDEFDEIIDLIEEKADKKHEHSERDIFDLDRVRYKGKWLNNFDYEANDLIIHKSKTYICIANNKGNEPPNNTFWDLIAAIKAEKAVKVIGVGGGTATPSGTSGVSDHALLTNLAYATSGHTGFLPDTHLTDFVHADIVHTNRTALDAVIGINTGDQDLSGYLKSGDNVSKLVNDAGYLTSFTETDPVFGASIAAGIDALDIAKWNAALQSGDNISELTNDLGYIIDAPSDDKIYGRRNGSWAEAGAGSNDHSILSNLDFASSGHTGFQKALTYDETLGSYLTD